MNDIVIRLPAQQWNVILNALGAQPFLEVADVIGAVKTQADQQIADAAETARSAMLDRAKAEVAGMSPKEIAAFRAANIPATPGKAGA